jgi:protein-L-isoaspartate(D-aspartate) O-methyltransferase
MFDDSSDLDAQRLRYAGEVRVAAGVRSDALVQAFATVPREHFLGSGPWHVMVRSPGGQAEYLLTEDADPSRVYANVVIAIDPSRGLNNGEPASWGAWIDSLNIKTGERIVHIGCGTGYYTAILAEIVGPTGQVLGIEVDPLLARRARINLAYLPQVQVAAGNGVDLDLDVADAILVNAGVTHPRAAWLDALSADGRLLLPITGATGLNSIGFGGMFVIARRRAEYAVAFVSPVGIFSCVGARDSGFNQQLLRKADDEWSAVSSLRRDVHESDESCWLHTPDGCLSTHPLTADAA